MLLDLSSGCAFQKPADEGDPQSIDDVASQGFPNAHNNEKKAEESARVGGDQGGAAEVLVRSPNDGAKDAASIEGESRDEVEQMPACR